ncbi:RIB43A-like with coiled-coils protein 1 [Ctenodactylus gundi]
MHTKGPEVGTVVLEYLIGHQCAWSTIYKVNLSSDAKEVAAMEARRNQEKDQQSQFFNEQNRVMGVDVEAQNNQVDEEKLQEAIEQSKEAAHGNHPRPESDPTRGTKKMQYDLVAQMIKKEEEERTRRLAKKIQDFRKQKQQFKKRCQFDQAQFQPVYFQEFPVQFQQFPVHFQQFPVQFEQFPVQFEQLPVHSQQFPVHSQQFPVQFEQFPVQFQQFPAQLPEFPAHFTDSNPSCGPATMQCFLGEDLDKDIFLKLQEWHFRHNLEKQLKEQHEAWAEGSHADTLSDQLCPAMDMQAAQLARLEESCHVAMVSSIANANIAQGPHQVAELAEQQHREHQYQQNANFTDIQNQVTSDLLTENLRVVQHPMATDCVLPYCWKDGALEEQATFRKAQEAQYCASRLKAEQASDTEWEKQTMQFAQATLGLQEQDLCAAFRRGLGSFSQQMDNDETAHQNYLNSIIYNNQPAAQYYQQINTSSY